MGKFCDIEYVFTVANGHTAREIFFVLLSRWFHCCSIVQDTCSFHPEGFRSNDVTVKRQNEWGPVWPDWAVLKVFGSIFFSLGNVAQKFIYFLGYFEKHFFFIKPAVTIFRLLVVNIWATFYLNIWSHWRGCSRPFLRLYKEGLFFFATASFANDNVIG